MRRFFILWGEQYLYSPTPLQKLLSTLLLPISYLYCALAFLRYRLSLELDLGVPIVSIGNLSVGGSGKTPLTSALAQRYKHSAIILRGYGRKSRGLQVVSDGSSVLCSVEVSGDEAMEYALRVPSSIIIVSEDRVKGIMKAKELGAKVIFLDDGYSKHNIKKLDIIIETNTISNRCLPSGAYRERLYSNKKALIIRDGVEFKRVVKIKNPDDHMVLVTAIARADRLDKYLPQLKGKYYFEDHHYFTLKELQDALDNSSADKILTTLKDYVKMRQFDLEIAIIELEIELNKSLINSVDSYIKEQI